jgi:arylsulfatase A-like enzyme
MIERIIYLAIAFATPCLLMGDVPRKPNIVLIVADDLGYGDLGCYGSRRNRTPQIDALAESGLCFTDFHSAGAMCTPTRAAMLTGLYPQRFGRRFDGPLSGKSDRDTGLPLQAVTIAERLKQSGYATACFGKWHLGYEPPFLPPDQGFDEFRGLASGDGDHHTHINRWGREDWWHGNRIRMEAGYTTDLLTRHGIDFMERHRNRPFFLYVSHLAIHFPWQGPDDPPHRVKGQTYEQDKWGIIPDPNHVSGHVRAMVEALDKSTGRIVQALDRLGLRERTLLVFTSDNGGYLQYGARFRNISSNGLLRGQKGELYEGGHRVPAIFSWPGVCVPARIEATAHSVDLMPTFARLADAPGAAFQGDGLDLSPLLFRGAALPQRPLFWRAGSEWAVRAGRWKLVGADRGAELYHLQADPGETQDLALQHPETVTRLRSQWESWDRESAQYARRYVRPFLACARECIDLLMQYGTDRYGPVHAPILVSILDVHTRSCPENPAAGDEAFRVTRRERRNPAGANLLTDQPLLRAMTWLSRISGDQRYRQFAERAVGYTLDHYTDEKGLLWWGWHRHVDVFRDTREGHQGHHHEIHAIHAIDWDLLWQVDRDAVQKQIEAIWTWHVIDKRTGEINRHDDGQRGCDFSMSAGAYIEAFAFLYSRTQDPVWLDRAKLLANYYWQRRHPQTGLFPERPNAGNARFDGASFVTAITGPTCQALLKAFDYTREPLFRDQAVAILKAYARYGFDRDTGKFWGALRLDGSVIQGPRQRQGYAQYEPRGHLELWEPYAAGYQYPLYTAQAYTGAYQRAADPELLKAARRFADWISRTPPGSETSENAWYRDYSRGPGRSGTYAGKYGRAVSFYLHLFLLSGQKEYLAEAHRLAHTAVQRLSYRGLLKGHPAKPTYEAMDGVGTLLYALLQLDQVLQDPKGAVARGGIRPGDGLPAMPLDNRGGRAPKMKRAIAVTLLAVWARAFGGAAPTPPNIVFILADDLGYGDLGCYGQRLIETPHVDQLAREGLRFTQAYAGGPVCTPSRSVLMTGLHGGHTPARDNIPHYPTYLRDEDVTVAEILKSAGYRCGGVGKWSLGDAGTAGRATNQGFDMWFGYLNQDHAHYYYTEYLDDNEGRLDLAGNSQTREHYSHDLLVDRALRFIDENHKTPFFLYAAFTLPHFSAADEDRDRFAVPSTAPYTGRDWDRKSKKYAAMVHRLDQAVGRIVDRVDARGLKESTLILFSSDNGGHAEVWEGFDTNGPLRGYKRHLTEGGIRVPFLVRWPGRVPDGRVSHEIIAFQDMLPTFAELAGAACPGNLDGISILRALLGQRLTEPRPALYWDYGHCRRRYDQAVRLGHWKGIRLGRHGPVQLYDLSQDVGEKNDVAQFHPDRVRQIEAIMQDAVVSSPRYPVGRLYRGEPIWQKSKMK